MRLAVCVWNQMADSKTAPDPREPSLQGDIRLGQSDPGAVVKLTSWRKGEQITVDLAAAISEQEARYERSRAEDGEGR